MLLLLAILYQNRKLLRILVPVVFVLSCAYFSLEPVADRISAVDVATHSFDVTFIAVCIYIFFKMLYLLASKKNCETPAPSEIDSQLSIVNKVKNKTSFWKRLAEALNDDRPPRARLLLTGRHREFERLYGKG